MHLAARYRSLIGGHQLTNEFKVIFTGEEWRMPTVSCYFFQVLFHGLVHTKGKLSIASSIYCSVVFLEVIWKSHGWMGACLHIS